MKTSMLTVIIALAAMPHATTAAPVEGGHIVRTVGWSDVPLPPGATLQDKPGDSPTLLVQHTDSKALQLPLWKLTAPGITKKFYALHGRLRCKDVDGIGYLEMWNEFPAAAGQPNLRYFSRSLAEQGPFGRITGSSDWREVFIPFSAAQSEQLPVALELNLILPGAGEVEITGLALVEFDDMAGLSGSMASHWGYAALTVVGLVSVLIAVMLLRRVRLSGETRRMRAMDTMP